MHPGLQSSRRNRDVPVPRFIAQARDLVLPFRVWDTRLMMKRSGVVLSVITVFLQASMVHAGKLTPTASVSNPIRPTEVKVSVGQALPPSVFKGTRYEGLPAAEISKILVEGQSRGFAVDSLFWYDPKELTDRDVDGPAGILYQGPNR